MIGSRLSSSAPVRPARGQALAAARLQRQLAEAHAQRHDSVGSRRNGRGGGLRQDLRLDPLKHAADLPVDGLRQRAQAERIALVAGGQIPQRAVQRARQPVDVALHPPNAEVEIDSRRRAAGRKDQRHQRQKDQNGDWPVATSAAPAHRTSTAAAIAR